MNESSSLFPGMRTFRSRLRAGDLLIGAAVTFNDPLVSDALSDSVDFLWYDLEHVKIDPSALNAHLMAARGRETATIVRVGGVSADEVKPVLDAGAEGLVAPQVTDVAQVEEFVSHCRYPPQGRRGLGPRVPTNYGRSGGPDHFLQANDTVFVSVMIETREAVEAIDEIVRVPGLDSVVLGLGDLSGSLGKLVDFNNPELYVCVDRVVEAARKVGMPIGAGAGFDFDFVMPLLSRGVCWVQFGNDFEYLVHSLDDAVALLRSKA